jgi:hypothetical protein
MDLEIRPRPGQLVWIDYLSTIKPTILITIATAMKCGVPVVPGTPGPVESYMDGESFIKEHGFPGTQS